MHLEHSDFTRYDYDYSLPCHCVISGGHASGMQWALRGAQAQSKQGVLDRCGKHASCGREMEFGDFCCLVCKKTGQGTNSGCIVAILHLVSTHRIPRSVLL